MQEYMLNVHQRTADRHLWAFYWNVGKSWNTELEILEVWQTWDLLAVRRCNNNMYCITISTLYIFFTQLFATYPPFISYPNFGLARNSLQELLSLLLYALNC